MNLGSLHELNPAETNPLKRQLADVLHAVRYLRGPLVGANIFAFLIELLFGG